MGFPSLSCEFDSRQAQVQPLIIPAILLALIPITHYGILFLISLRKNRLNQLHNNLAITILDWLFIPFNAILLFAVEFSWILFLFGVITISVGLSFLHERWKHQSTWRPETAYCITKEGLTPEGWVHYVFMTIQTALVIAAFFSPAKGPMFLVLLGLLLTYLVGFILIVHAVRKRSFWKIAEWPYLIIGIAALIIRGAAFLI